MIILDCSFLGYAIEYPGSSTLSKIGSLSHLNIARNESASQWKVYVV